MSLRSTIRGALAGAAVWVALLASSCGGPAGVQPDRDAGRGPGAAEVETGAAVRADGPAAGAPDAAAVAPALPPPAADAGAGGGGGAAVDATVAPRAGAPHVFVIAMENHRAADVYGSASAPYINGSLLPIAASAANFLDEAPALPSEPHWIWLEAGTNVFPDRTFDSDAPPSATNSTASTQHLVTQIRAAGGGLDWVSYQEGLPAAHTCPLVSTALYVARHDPFLFFRDVVGSPPSATEPYCADHHRPMEALAGDLAAGSVASYVFISPNLCHDMHGASACANADKIKLGDDWLQQTVSPLLAFVNAHGGVIFITWDEDGPMPFIAVGPNVKPGYRSTVRLDHGSILKSIELLLGLPVLPSVASQPDLSDLFQPGKFP